MKNKIKGLIAAIVLAVGIGAVGVSPSPAAALGGGYTGSTNCNVVLNSLYRICVDPTTPYGPSVYVFTDPTRPYNYTARAHLSEVVTSGCGSVCRVGRGQYSTQGVGFDHNVNYGWVGNCLRVAADGVVGGNYGTYNGLMHVWAPCYTTPGFIAEWDSNLWTLTYSDYNTFWAYVESAYNNGGDFVVVN